MHNRHELVHGRPASRHGGGFRERNNGHAVEFLYRVLRHAASLFSCHIDVHICIATAHTFLLGQKSRHSYPPTAIPALSIVDRLFHKTEPWIGIHCGSRIWLIPFFRAFGPQPSAPVPYLPRWSHCQLINQTPIQSIL